MTSKVVLRTDYVNEQGLHQVILRVTINRKYRQYDTHVRVKPEDFDPVKGLVKTKHPNHKDLNKKIQNAVSKFIHIDTVFYLQNIEPTHEAFESMFYEKASNTNVHYVFQSILQYRIEIREIEKSTAVAHRCLIKRLYNYAPRLKFADLNAKFLAKWDESLMKEGLGQNQRHKLLKTFKALCNYAKRAPWFIKFISWPFDQYKVAQIEGRRDYLREDELQKLIHLYDDELQTSYFERQVLRVFLFMCFTGLRFSDAMLIDNNNIYGKSLRFIPHKTKRRAKHLVLPLSNSARKYLWDESRTRFPIITNQVFNRVLKRLNDAAGLNKHLCSHMARHTFTTLLLRKGVAIQDVKELRGDSKLTTTMTYFHTENDYLREKISVLDSI
jgi:site-specific recombinase XerD